ncbi:MAG: prepilin peptidase [Propioniciclava sp.]
MPPHLNPLGVATVMAVTILTVTLAIPLLRGLPRAPDAPDYAALGTPRFLAAAAGCAVVGTGVLVWAAPMTHWPPWIALTIPGIAAILIDARTMWLPRRLTQIGSGLILAGVLTTGWLHGSLAPLIAAAWGAVALGGFYFVVWRVSGQLGFGDVRLMAMVGAVAALEGAQFVVVAALLGSIVGVLWGIIHQLHTRQPGPFPYGPALFSGPYLALAVRALGGL